MHAAEKQSFWDTLRHVLRGDGHLSQAERLARVGWAGGAGWLQSCAGGCMPRHVAVPAPCRPGGL